MEHKNPLPTLSWVEQLAVLLEEVSTVVARATFAGNPPAGTTGPLFILDPASRQGRLVAREDPGRDGANRAEWLEVCVLLLQAALTLRPLGVAGWADGTRWGVLVARTTEIQSTMKRALAWVPDWGEQLDLWLERVQLPSTMD
jgi:hypothetical protein